MSILVPLRAISICCFLIASFCSVNYCNADKLDVDKLQSKIFSAVEKSRPAVVAINDRGSVFSGVIVNKGGLVLSAGHAVRPYRTYTVMLPDGRKFKAKSLGVNLRIDMAMIQINNPENLPVAKLGRSSSIRPNQPVIGISYPGLYLSQRGSVIRFGYVKRPVTANEGMIETTSMMEPGDSGGPLINLDGEVIGIHSNIRDNVQLNYDVPIDSFVKYWDDLKEPGWFEIDGWPSLPKFGFRASDAEDREGVKVIKIDEGGLAEQGGLKANDIITQIAGRKIATRREFSDRLVGLRSRGEFQMDLTVVRSGKPIMLQVNARDKSLPEPKSYKELLDFASMFQSLESRLDDVEYVVHSNFGERSTNIRATRIFRGDTGVLVTKSTRVGENPQVELPGGARVQATVIKRDKANDLVLLKASLPGKGGIDLRNVLGDLAENPGQLLLTPDNKGPGTISVWGSKYFSSPRTTESGGFLGVRLGKSNDGAVLFDTVLRGGAAKRAGIKRGDVLVRMDETPIDRQTDVFKFLDRTDPNSKITLVVNRDEKELKKVVFLGKRTTDTGHVADDLQGGKSSRRDGFRLVISHDAVLYPEQCGGPVFDIKGNFLGINIARKSRTRCFAIPKTIVKRFVDSSGL